MKTKAISVTTTFFIITSLLLAGIGIKDAYALNVFSNSECYPTTFGTLSESGKTQTAITLHWHTSDARTTRAYIKKRGESTWHLLGPNPSPYVTSHTVSTATSYDVSLSPPKIGYALSPGTTYDYFVYGINWGISGVYKCIKSTPIKSFTTLSPPPIPPPPPLAPPTGGSDTGGTESGGDSGTTLDTGSSSGGGTEDIAAAITDDKEPPTSPENLKADYNKERNEIDLSWDASVDEGLAGYEVERTEKSKEQWKKVGDSDSGSYADFEFAPNTAYEYRVRAFDAAKNYSLYSNVAEVLSGEFTPNVTVNNGGTVQSEDGLAIATFPSKSVSEDLFVSLEKSNEQNFELESGDAIVGNIYKAQAKNNRGDDAGTFNAQITLTLKFASKDLRNVNSSTLRIGKFNEENVEYPSMSVDQNAGEAKTLTDHFSEYFLVAKKGNSFTTFLKILIWILVIAGLGAGGYFGWQWWQRRKYQEEHREDYIYKH